MAQFSNFVKEEVQNLRGGPGKFLGKRVNAGAKHRATEADRVNRIEAKNMADRALQKAKVASSKGEYFCNINVPKKFVDKVAKELRGLKYLVATSSNLIPGSKSYSEIAIYFGHQSSRMKTDPNFIEYYPDCVATFLAECAAHGVTNGISGKINDFIDIKDSGTELYFYEQIAHQIGYMMAFKTKAQTVMRWSNKGIMNEKQIMKGIRACFPGMNFDKIYALIEDYEKMTPQEKQADHNRIVLELGAKAA